MRRFVLVTATRSEPDLQDWTASGIRKLKRGVSLPEFMNEYLEPFGLKDKELLMRGETLMILTRSEGKVMTWAFTEYPEDDLIRAVSNLTREELLRDLKELLPLKNISR